MDLTLIRHISNKNGTFGILYKDGSQLCVTCEDPWNDNMVGSSCIVPGTYKVERHESAKFPHTWELMDVPCRIGILIHNGNTIQDTHGCILVGISFGIVAGLPAVVHSVEALSMLRNTLPDNFILTVKENYGLAA